MGSEEVENRCGNAGNWLSNTADTVVEEFQ